MDMTNSLFFKQGVVPDSHQSNLALEDLCR